MAFNHVILRRAQRIVLVLTVCVLHATTNASASLLDGVQVFATPRGEAQNVRFEQSGGGVVIILYDLIASDQRAVFDVMLEASQDAGSTWGLRPRTVTGDVGAGVKPGPGKRIEWDSGKDVERILIDQFRFRIVPTAGPLQMQPAGGTTGAATGVLTIVTSPSGAQVNIDGTPRGTTPLTLRDLKSGSHRISVSLTGYLENIRAIEIPAGQSVSVDVPLTEDPRAKQPGQTTTAAPKKGGNGKWFAIAGGAGAAAIAAVAAGGKSTPTTGGSGGSSGGGSGGGVQLGSISVSPSGDAIAAVTNYTFALIFTRPSSATSFRWDFGDVSTATTTTSTVQKTYSSSGTFKVDVSAVDSGSVIVGTASLPSVRVVVLSGAWGLRLSNGTALANGRGIALNQNGSSLNGDISPLGNCIIGVSGIISPDRSISLSFFPDAGGRTNCSSVNLPLPSSFSGTPNSSVDSFSGSIPGLGAVTMFRCNNNSVVVCQ